MTPQPLTRRLSPQFPLQPRALNRILAAIVLVGLLLRLAQYFYNRALWWDEAMVALNILDRSYRGLTQPLDYFQGAPILFLWLEKLMTQLLGPGELALRLWPLVASSVALGLMAWSARRLLPGLDAIIVTLFFAVADSQIFYATEVKQYSTDVLVALLLIAAFLAHRRAHLGAHHRVGWWQWALGGAIVIWVSHPAVFGLAGLGLALVIQERAEDRLTLRRLVQWAGVALIWLVSFGLVYWISLRHLGNSPYLLAYWIDQDAFAPGVNPLANIGWLGNSYLVIFSNPTGLTPIPLAAALFILGLMGIASPTPVERAAPVGKKSAQPGSDQRNRAAASHQPSSAYPISRDSISGWSLVCLLLLPLALTLVASLLGRYPFRDRLILFLTPAVVLMVGLGLARLRILLGRPGVWVVALVGVLLLAQPVGRAFYHVAVPRTGQEFDRALDELVTQVEVGDIIYIYARAGPQLTYYLTQHGNAARYTEALAATTVIFGTERAGLWENHQRELDTLMGAPRVWVLFPTGFHLRDGLAYLQEQGRQEVTIELPGAELLRFDLSRAE